MKEKSTVVLAVVFFVLNPLASESAFAGYVRLECERMDL